MDPKRPAGEEFRDDLRPLGVAAAGSGNAAARRLLSAEELAPLTRLDDWRSAGAVLDAVLARMNAFGRIAMCGMISGYNGAPIPLQQPQLILQSRLTVEGFIVSEHMEFWPPALTELGGMVATGKLKFRESVAQGLDAAPEAFLGLLKGRNFGKQLVKLI